MSKRPVMKGENQDLTLRASADQAIAVDDKTGKGLDGEHRQNERHPLDRVEIATDSIADGKNSK